MGIHFVIQQTIYSWGWWCSFRWLTVEACPRLCRWVFQFLWDTPLSSHRVMSKSSYNVYPFSFHSQGNLQRPSSTLFRAWATVSKHVHIFDLSWVKTSEYVMKLLKTGCSKRSLSKVCLQTNTFGLTCLWSRFVCVLRWISCWRECRDKCCSLRAELTTVVSELLLNTPADGVWSVATIAWKA